MANLLSGLKGSFGLEKVQSPTRRESALAELERITKLCPDVIWESDEWGRLFAPAESIPGILPKEEQYELHVQRDRGCGYDVSFISGETDTYYIHGSHKGRIASDCIVEKTSFRFGAFKILQDGAKVIVQEDTI